MASASEDQRKLAESGAFRDQKPPTVEYVTWLLTYGDTVSQKSPLHRLGTSAADAASGNHSHRGTDSVKLFDLDNTFTGDLSTAGGVRNALKQVMAALVELGATDSTTN